MNKKDASNQTIKAVIVCGKLIGKMDAQKYGFLNCKFLFFPISNKINYGSREEKFQEPEIKLCPEFEIEFLKKFIENYSVGN